MARNFPDLKDFARHRILNDVVGSVNREGQWKVLIVDDQMLSVANSVVSPYEIMERGVALVERMRPNKDRERLPEFDAIYLLCPTAHNVSILIDDFKSSSPQYQSAHVFFSASLSQNLLSELRSSNLVTSRRLKSVKEVPLRFLAFEPNVFLSPSLPPLSTLFPAPNASSSSITSLTGLSSSMEEFATVISALNLKPVIRFRKCALGVNNLAASKLASYLNLRSSPNDNSPSDCTILILDRIMDMEAPLIHELSYQALVFDAIPSSVKVPSSLVYRTSGNEERHVFLDESDEFWKTSRYQHIAEVCERLRDLAQCLPDSGLGNSQEMSIGDLRKAMTNLPGYQEQVRRVTNHLEITGKCLERISADKLHPIMELEQELVTGEDEDGKSIGTMGFKKVSDVLQGERLSLDICKRLLLLYFVSQEKSGSVPFKQRQHMINDLASIPSQEQGCFNALSSLTMTGFVNQRKARRSLRRRQLIDDSKYALCRFTPRFRAIVDDWLGNRLDNDQFPFLFPGTAVSRRNSKLIVYIIGGITGSELRVLNELAPDSQVLIGGTSIINPGEFVSQLDDLGK
ncbi:hypothetical protein RCL1_004217 [Eukaryota sp. TZLM3-RCL]